MFRKLDFRLFWLYLLLLIQLLLLAYYILMAPFSDEHSKSTPQPQSLRNKLFPVKFVTAPNTNLQPTEKLSEYFTDKSKINLPYTSLDDYFITINNSVCFVRGTDLKYMARLAIIKSHVMKCECYSGWHGADCGQPEVVWRSFMATKQKIVPRRRLHPRKIVHGFPIVNMETTLIEIKLNELFDVVDMYIICESSHTESGDRKKLYFKNRLTEKYLKRIEPKIMYIPYEKEGARENVSQNIHVKSMRKYLWSKGRSAITNLQSDDLFVTMDSYEIPNTKALLFFKLYDGWPQPIGFRLRWSAFGFFWQHPRKTMIAPGVATVQLVDDTFHGDPSSMREEPIRGQEESLSLSSYGLVVGDLNHYGGWHCSWCLEPSDIVATLGSISREISPVSWDNPDTRTVDTKYVQDLIGTGLWLDGKTALVRVSRYSDQYFAPQYVMNNTWRFDTLVTNFYADIDYN